MSALRITVSLVVGALGAMVGALASFWVINSSACSKLGGAARFFPLRCDSELGTQGEYLLAVDWPVIAITLASAAIVGGVAFMACRMILRSPDHPR
jgi:hypothetical protein